MTDLVLITDQDKSYLISKSSVASVHWDNDYSSTTIIMKERRKRYQDEEAFNQFIILNFLLKTFRKF